MSTDSQSKTIQQHLKDFIGALFVVAFTFGLIEIGLRVLDPWGIVYFDDLTELSQQFVYDETRLIVLPDGDYQFSSWDATMRDDVRVTPATTPSADCTIVFLGDSVTFGYGVSDDETWINVIAANFPDVTFKNTGITLYASQQILGTYRAFPDADGYIYLITGNDHEQPQDIRTGQFINAGESLPYLVKYPNFYLNFRSDFDIPRRPTESTVTDEDAVAAAQTIADAQLTTFYDDLAALTANDDLILAGFPADIIVQGALAEGFEIEQLPPYPIEYAISYADVHLNAQGNRVLADYMLPVVEQVVDAQCT